MLSSELKPIDQIRDLCSPKNETMTLVHIWGQKGYTTVSENVILTK